MDIRREVKKMKEKKEEIEKMSEEKYYMRDSMKNVEK
jgi:hypothetical protein